MTAVNLVEARDDLTISLCGVAAQQDLPQPHVTFLDSLAVITAATTEEVAGWAEALGLAFSVLADDSVATGVWRGWQVAARIGAAS